MPRVTVAVDPAYEVVVGDGVLVEVAGLLRDRRRVTVVSQARVAQLHGTRVRDALVGAGIAVDELAMDEGEEAKSLATIETLCRGFARGGLLRGDAVVALGGGVVGDTAGFAAAVYHRGVAVVQAPTTLLAQVDAAIGGKTAVNLVEGKNLVGAFHQPLGVVADTSTLATLPDREYRSGLGEVAKYALMPDGEAVAAIVEREREAVIRRDPEVLARLVAACAAIKAAVVAEDPEERTGRRAVLNYGHTLAHALETVGRYDLLHGEAVAVGLQFAAHLACELGRLDVQAVDRHRTLVQGLGLPVTVPESEPLTVEALLEVMRRDKKAAGGLTFVLPGPPGLVTVDDPPARALAAAFAAVGIGHRGD